MDVRIVDFPATKVAVVEHRGSPTLEHVSIRRLVAWRIENKLPLLPVHRSYGVHYNDPRTVPENEYRVDLCVSVEHEVKTNPQGVINKVIPACRCAVARHFGSRTHVSAAHYLYEEWLPNSAEQLAEFPMFFHYVNVGPALKDDEMITDVYLPLM